MKDTIGIRPEPELLLDLMELDDAEVLMVDGTGLGVLFGRETEKRSQDAGGEEVLTKMTRFVGDRIRGLQLSHYYRFHKKIVRNETESENYWIIHSINTALVLTVVAVGLQQELRCKDNDVSK